MKALPQLDTLDTAKLEALVRHHNHRYWDLDAPEISDTDFDRLIEALRRSRPDSPVLEALGPTQFRAEVSHRAPMLSLGKAYTKEGVWAFVVTPKTQKRKINGALVISPKIDGVACSLVYGADGQLLRAATRGDGRRGEDITANARRITEVPQRINASGAEVEVRGELYLRRSRFQEKFAAEFANPRNLTAGAIKQKDPRKTSSYGLSFFSYDLLGVDAASEQDKLERLRSWGFEPPPVEQVGSDDLEALWSCVQRVATQARELDCDADGVVIKAADLDEQMRLGATDHHPSYAIAFKFQGETGESTLRQVEWSVARTGRVTPVAIVDPVFLSGANVSRASLHNLEIFEQLGVSEGCAVLMTRRGDVIPQVERVLTAGGTAISPPTRCPSCGGTVERRDKFLYCVALDSCPDALVSTLEHFCKVLDIEGFGAKHLRALVATQTVRRPVDFFTLDAAQLLALREVEVTTAEGADEPERIRIGDKLAGKLVGAIQARRRIPLATFLTALGIEDLGPVMAEKLVEQLGDLAAIRDADAERIVAIEGFGAERARSIVEGLRDLGERIELLLEHIELVAAPAPATAGHPLAGKAVVFTGSMATLDRKQAQKSVKAVGGKAPSAVTKELDYLVIGDKGSPLIGDGKKSSKQKTAERYITDGARIEIITEGAFLELLGED